MIRTSSQEDGRHLETLYKDSIYGQLPRIVEWALGEASERIRVVEENHEIVASAYIDVCGYHNRSIDRRL